MFDTLTTGINMIIPAAAATTPATIQALSLVLQPAAFQQNKLTLPSFWMENLVRWFSMLSRICACLSFSALLYVLHTSDNGFALSTYSNIHPRPHQRYYRRDTGTLPSHQRGSAVAVLIITVADGASSS
jgi:hypothetical protein